MKLFKRRKAEYGNCDAPPVETPVRYEYGFYDLSSAPRVSLPSVISKPVFRCPNCRGQASADHGA